MRFVSTPEILERVSIVSTELSQIEEDVNVQANESSQVCLTWTHENWEWFQFRNSDGFPLPRTLVQTSFVMIFWQ